MATRRVDAPFDKWGGLSDRSFPLNVSRIESPDLRNVDWHERTMSKRHGMARTHTNMLRDSSIHFDGLDDYLRIRHIAAYQPAASDELYLSIDVVLRAFPEAEGYVISKGTGTTTSRFLSISYDPSINTNQGGWRLRVRDAAGAGANVVVTVNDGIGTAGVPVDTYRHIELYPTATDTYTFRVLDEDGAVVGAAATGLTIATWLTSTADIFVGSDTGATGFLDATMAELRIDVDTVANVSPLIGVVGQELQPTAFAAMAGYWRFNDGNGSQITDLSSNANHGVAGGEGAAWLSTAGQGQFLIGPTGLAFYGDAGHIHWKATNVASLIFSNTPAGPRRWLMGFLWVPLVDSGDAGVPRAQTLFWSGIGTTDPAPLGIVVTNISGTNRLVCWYRDGTSRKQVALTGLDLSLAVGRRIRVHASLGFVNGAERLDFQAFVQGLGTFSGNVATDNANPSSISPDWSIARLVTSFAYPQTLNDRAAFSILYDFAFVRAFGTVAAPAPGPPSLGNPTSTVQFLWSNLGSGYFQASVAQMVAGLPVQDGGGNSLRTTGTVSTGADLYPEEEQGLLWDSGLVEPYEAVEGQHLGDFNTISPDGSTKRQILAISGTTLYSIDFATQLATPLAGNLHKGGKWKTDQYGSTIYFASANGKRPRKWNGSTMSWVGIRAPFQTPVAVSAAGGSLPAGTYNLYVTFRNPSTGDESGPSPTASVVVPATGRLTSVQLPVSSDPQVTQRRIYMTVANGGDGSTAYRVATIDNNTLVNYVTPITSVSTAEITLRYTGQDEAPPGSVLGIFKDRLFVAGWTQFPTRVYFSSPGQLGSFNLDTGFVEADLDSGDPITAIEPLRDVIVAHFRDGRMGLTVTGDVTDPIFVNNLSLDAGAVGPLAAKQYEAAQIYVAERDIWLWDGAAALNLSSPDEPGRPSIQNTMRTGIEPSRRRDISVSLNRQSQQWWFTYTTTGQTRNDSILIFQWDLGIWSRYDMDMDVVAELENVSDEPSIYGISRGFVVKLDTGDFDGHSLPVATIAGTPTSGTTLALVDTTKAWTPGAFKGLYVSIYDTSANAVRRALIASNSATQLNFYTALAAAPATADRYAIGVFPWYADFNLNFGNPAAMTNKKLMWFRARGISDATNLIRVTFIKNQLARSLTPSIGKDYVASWTSGETFKQMMIGGIARNWRMRIGDTAIGTTVPSEPIPTLSGRIDLHAFSVEADENKAR